MESQLEQLRPLVKQALELGKKGEASAASVTALHQKKQSVSFQANRLKSCSTAEESLYTVTFVLNGRRGSASGNIPEALPTVVARALAFARNGAVSHFDKYPAPAEKYPVIPQWHKGTAELSRERLCDDCGNMVSQLLQMDSALQCDAGGEVAEVEGIAANDAGFWDESLQESLWTLEAGFQKTTGTDMLFSGEGRRSCRLDELYSPDAIVAAVQEDYERSRQFAKVASGPVTLIIPPIFLRRFLTSLTMGINGRNVFKGTSPLKNLLNTACFSENLTVTDEPHIPYAESSSAYDAAGIPTARRVLVEKGVLKSFLYDYDTACQAGVAPTGNDDCAPWCLTVAPGTKSYQDLFAGVARGLYVRELVGFGQTNVMNGDFSANVSLGFWVENGKMTGRVKDAMISGNLFDLLKGRVEFSLETDAYSRMPYAFVPGGSLKN